MTTKSINDILSEEHSSARLDTDYNIGAFYFPGWTTPGGGPNPTNPWTTCPTNRTPLIGQFNEALQSVCDYNMELARDFGIKFFSYDWYADLVSNAYVPFLDHAINNHMASSVVDKPKFCVNYIHDYNTTKFTTTTWHVLYDYWIANYFNSSNYLTIGGKPVVMIYGVDNFNTRMGGGVAVATQLNNLRSAAITAGFSGVHIIGCVQESASFWMDWSVTAGFDGMTSYGAPKVKFHRGDNTSATPAATGFALLDDCLYGPDETISAVTNYHSWCGDGGYAIPPTLTDNGTAWVAPTLPTAYGFLGKNIPSFMIPISSGWDSRGQDHTSTFYALPTDTEFEAHLNNAKRVIDTYRSKTQGFGVIAAWNEFGEGQYLMPTVSGGYSKLNIVQKVFG